MKDGNKFVGGKTAVLVTRLWKEHVHFILKWKSCYITARYTTSDTINRGAFKYQMTPSRGVRPFFKLY